jgi:uracil-DNA glycosylase family 4
MEFKEIFRSVHAGHARCLRDEWLSRPCPVGKPIVWSRRNGPWHQSDILWVGAAPGNAGGRGAGNMGAHGTRIPFGGDIAGANLEVFMSTIGVTRNDTFLSAAYNKLPEAGGGEPTVEELTAPIGKMPSSIHLCAATIEAVQPRMIVCLGNVGLRTVIATANDFVLPSLGKVQKAGFSRGEVGEWAGLPPILWITHPSAQNMSPYAGTHTVFHTRMLDALDGLKKAYKKIIGKKIPSKRPLYPTDGIYALPEWVELVGPRHEMLDELWREKGV